MVNMTFNATHLTPHEAISDAVLRMVQGLDDNSPSLFASALIEDATWEFRDFSFLADFKILTGREHITSTILKAGGKMETTHMPSNFRTEISEDRSSARLTCYALAQHWRPGQGQNWVFGNCFLMGNRYEAELVKDADGLWKFRTFVLRCIWSQGDAGVMSHGDWDRTEERVRNSIAASIAK